MKTGCCTINQLIGLLEKAKQGNGGKRRVMLFDRHGDQIQPKSLEEGTLIRGNASFDFVAFSEEPQP